MNYRTISIFYFSAWTAACLPQDDADKNTDTDTETDADTDTHVNGDTETASDDTDNSQFYHNWTFTSGWDGFMHAFGDIEFTHNAAEGTLALNAQFTGPDEESLFGQEFFAADWQGASAIDVVLRTVKYTDIYWHLELDTGYAWTPCITAIEPAATAEWTTITFDILEVCAGSLDPDMIQALLVGVVTGSDATTPQTVQAAVDSITVR